jgi:hypothetical protein
MTETHLPKLGTDLVTALSGLDVNNFSHGDGERGICLSQQAEAAVNGCLALHPITWFGLLCLASLD